MFYWFCMEITCGCLTFVLVLLVFVLVLVGFVLFSLAKLFGLWLFMLILFWLNYFGFGLICVLKLFWLASFFAETIIGFCFDFDCRMAKTSIARNSLHGTVSNSLREFFDGCLNLLCFAWICWIFCAYGLFTTFFASTTGPLGPVEAHHCSKPRHKIQQFKLCSTFVQGAHSRAPFTHSIFVFVLHIRS